MSPLRAPRKADGIVYGPVPSRRLGRSLGINVFGSLRKVCSFDCLYCQLGWTRARVGERAAGPGLPRAADVEGALRERLARLVRAEGPPDRITFSGNGEPTAHPDFESIVDSVCRIRDVLSPGVRVAVLTNGAHLGRPEVKKALSMVDEPIVKLDAGLESTFRRLNRPRGDVSLGKLVRELRRIPRPILQTLFVRGRVDNSAPSEVEAWLERVMEIQPVSVQIHTLDRIPADPGLLPVPGPRLAEIAARFRRACSIPLEVVFPD